MATASVPLVACSFQFKIAADATQRGNNRGNSVIVTELRLTQITDRSLETLCRMPTMQSIYVTRSHRCGPCLPGRLATVEGGSSKADSECYRGAGTKVFLAHVFGSEVDESAVAAARASGEILVRAFPRASNKSACDLVRKVDAVSAGAQRPVL